MATPFKFLSVSEFEALSAEEKRAYVSAATAELERTKLDPASGGWHRLFRQDQQNKQQTQQAQQPQRKDDPEQQEPKPD